MEKNEIIELIKAEIGNTQPDSLEWGSASKDAKAKLYYNVKTMSKEEIKEMINTQNELRAYASRVA